jgi:hypothetical protein
MTHDDFSSRSFERAPIFITKAGGSEENFVAAVGRQRNAGLPIE